jgi:hypothetical protein
MTDGSKVTSLPPQYLQTEGQVQALDISIVFSRAKDSLLILSHVKIYMDDCLLGPWVDHRFPDTSVIWTNFKAMYSSWSLSVFAK